jgi:hypothetical protein
MIRITSIFFSILLCSAQAFSQSNQKKIKVYLLGTFHFTQSDTTIYDVRSEKNQKSIQKLSDIIVGLYPDKIFIEKMPEWEYENHIDSLYQEYKKGNLNRARNEIWQVAGRTAMRLNHPHLYQCDQPGNYSLYYGMLEEYAKWHNQSQQLENYNGKGMTGPITNNYNTDSLRNNSDLLDYIRWWNSKEVQNTSHAHYINVYPQIGNTNAYTPANRIDSTYFSGADLTIDWYRRNILIYAKMISQLDYNENAIFLIIGNDHVPIIRQMFYENPYFEVVDTEKWLGKTKIKRRENYR